MTLPLAKKCPRCGRAHSKACKTYPRRRCRVCGQRYYDYGALPAGDLMFRVCPRRALHKRMRDSHEALLPAPTGVESVYGSGSHFGSAGQVGIRKTRRRLRDPLMEKLVHREANRRWRENLTPVQKAMYKERRRQLWVKNGARYRQNSAARKARRKK